LLLTSRLSQKTASHHSVRSTRGYLTELLGVLESVLIHAERAFQMIDPREDLRVGYSLVRDQGADIFKVAVGFRALVGGPAGVAGRILGCFCVPRL
jgi:hypothetical protein